MARGLANQIINSTPGMTVAAVFSRRPERAIEALGYAGVSDIVEAGTQKAVDDAVRAGKAVASADAFLLARSPQIDVLVDTTGSGDFGAAGILEAVTRGKD